MILEKQWRLEYIWGEAFDGGAAGKQGREGGTMKRNKCQTTVPLHNPNKLCLARSLTSRAHHAVLPLHPMAELSGMGGLGGVS